MTSDFACEAGAVEPGRRLYPFMLRVREPHRTTSARGRHTPQQRWQVATFQEEISRILTYYGALYALDGSRKLRIGFGGISREDRIMSRPNPESGPGSWLRLMPPESC